MKKLWICLLAAALLLSGGIARADAREELIDRMVATAKDEYEQAEGEPLRAHYAEDRYVCKNFVAYLLHANSRGYRMAAYPDVALRMPGNLPEEDCVPHAYGIAWKDVSAAEGNPYEAVASFRYDERIPLIENERRMLALMKEVRRGDILQMVATYDHGNGPHTLMFIADYDRADYHVHWTDSNMRGGNSGGVRYGIIQYDRSERIDWFVEAVAHTRHGATLYRLREDIVRVD